MALGQRVEVVSPQGEDQTFGFALLLAAIRVDPLNPWFNYRVPAKELNGFRASFVMSPHAEDLDGAFGLIDLIDQAVLDVDAARVGPD